EGLTFINFEIHPRDPRLGRVLPFTVTWRADAPMSDAYAVSVRLLRPDDTVLPVQDERHPVLGTSPTNTWAVGQIVGDYHELPIGTRVPPGTYRLQIIPYQVDPVRNLREAVDEQPPGGDF